MYTSPDSNLKGGKQRIVSAHGFEIELIESKIVISNFSRLKNQEFEKRISDLAQKIVSLQKDLKPKNIEILGFQLADVGPYKAALKCQPMPQDSQEIEFNRTNVDLKSVFEELKSHSEKFAELFGGEVLKNEELKEIITRKRDNKTIYVQMFNSRFHRYLPTILIKEFMEPPARPDDLFSGIKIKKPIIKIFEPDPEEEEVKNENTNSNNQATTDSKHLEDENRGETLGQDKAGNKKINLSSYNQSGNTNTRNQDGNPNVHIEEQMDDPLLKNYQKFDFRNKSCRLKKPIYQIIFSGKDPKTNQDKHLIKSQSGVLIYEGTLNEKEEKHGRGRLYYPNGDIYEGEFKNDKREGGGVLYFKAGGTHEHAGGRYYGEFKDDLIDGPGELVDKNGLIMFRGMFEKGFKVNGRLLLDGSDWYVGQFSNNYRHGDGTLFVKNGVAFEGSWNYGRKHGSFKRYKTWKFDEHEFPKIDENSGYDTVHYRQDVLSSFPPGTKKIQIIQSDGTKTETQLQAESSKAVKEVANRYGVRVTTEDLQTLEGSNLLGANIINFYLRAIEAEYLKRQYESNRGNPQSILFLDSDFFSDLTSGDLESSTTYYDRVKHRFAAYSSSQHLIFDEFERILIIVNERGLHWLLAEIYCSKNEGGRLKEILFRIYDSMVNEPDSLQSVKDYHVTRHLLEFVKNEFKKVKQSPEITDIIKKLERSVVDYQDVPQQKDLNCGVFVSRLVQYIAAGKDKFDFDFEVKSINAFRNEIRNVILGQYCNPLQLERPY